MITSEQLIPISKMHTDQSSVLEKTNDGPVFLAQRSTLAAVLISPTQWDRLLAKLEELEDVIDVLEARLELATGVDELVELTESDIQELRASADAVPA